MGRTLTGKDFHIFSKSFARILLERIPTATDVCFLTAVGQLDTLLAEMNTSIAGLIALEVDDSEYEEWKALFAKKGVSIEKEITWDKNHGARSFFFRDPAGNNIEIAEKKLWGSEVYEDK